MMQTELAKWQAATDLPYDLKRQLQELLADDDALKDAFSGELSFGTAGMRGLMGPGTNRMNIYTVAKVTESLAKFMDELTQANRAAGVVISYDSRYHSREFAETAAAVLGAHGIKTFLFDALRPTPELSFAVRYLHAYAGIMITASHNPKQYNGYKIYGPDGGQMPPKEVNAVVAKLGEITDIFAIEKLPLEKMTEQKLLQYIGEDIDEAYLAKLKSVIVDPQLVAAEGNKIHFVYTPLHGTGKMLYSAVYRENGFDQVQIVAKQAILDPEFSTVAFPNPEFPAAFDLGISEAKKTDANLIIATDPDADRLGAAVKKANGEYELLSGNQIATLITAYLLQKKQALQQLPTDGEIVKSIVSSELPAKIAASYGVKTKNVLTGFKYIGEEIQHLNDTRKGTFLFGFEESYGYLLKDFVRDKDAMQAALILAEIASFYAEKGMTLADGLQSLFETYGYFHEITHSAEFPGLQGQAQMQAMMSRLRQENLSTVADTKVIKVEDYLQKTVTTEGQTTALTGFDQADVLKYYLADGTWFALRPSGTEPKIKLYVGVQAETSEQATKLAESYTSTLVKEVLKPETK